MGKGDAAISVEIEVTPEMIEVGGGRDFFCDVPRRAYVSWDCGVAG